MSSENPERGPTGRRERRAVPRYEAVEQRARLAWRAAGPRFQQAAVRLVDISEKGAQVVAGFVLSESSDVWIGLTILPWEWVKARIRGSEASGDEWSYHLSFHEPCPEGMIEKATRVEETIENVEDSLCFDHLFH